VTLAGTVALAMLALMVGFLGLIVIATLRQLRGEVREAAERREL
jgi:hypothetical protein